MRACWRARLGDVTWVGVWLIAAASAQSRPTWPELRAQLRSSDPAQVAWAAHHVAEAQLAQAGPDLTRALDQLRHGDREQSNEEIHVVLALLDAAIRCGAKLPGEALARWSSVPECASVLLAYAAREPATTTPLVRAVLDATDNPVTRSAACNLMLASDPRALVAQVLAHASIHVEVEVVTAGAPAPSICVNIAYCKSQFERLGVAGFPPLHRYRIEPAALREQLLEDPSERLSVDGPMSLSFVRVSESDPKHNEFLFGMTYTRDEYAVLCLDRLVPRPKGAPELRNSVSQRHEWRDVDTWNSAVATRTLAMRDRWHQIGDWLTAQRMVDATQAAKLRAAFHIEVRDRRVDRTRPLPEIK